MKFDVDESDLQMTNMNFENEINAQINIYFQEWNWSQVGNFILFFPKKNFKIWAKFSKILENLLQFFFPFSFFWVTTMKNFTPCPPKKNADHKMKLTNGIEIVTQQLCLNEFHKFFSENTTTNFPSFPMPKSGPLGGKELGGAENVQATIT